jgi:hypothetical protein
MLELRPNCECCDKDLPPDSTEAYICSYECTFCHDCVEQRLSNVCPNCGGGFSPRPIRPVKGYREGVGLEHHPASSLRVHTAYSDAELSEFSALIKATEPSKR